MRVGSIITLYSPNQLWDLSFIWLRKLSMAHGSFHWLVKAFQLLSIFFSEYKLQKICSNALLKVNTYLKGTSCSIKWVFLQSPYQL